MKKCTDCRFCICIDEGYSNWTIEGTKVDCLLKEHPKFPTDRFYEKEKELLYADKCFRFLAGDHVEIDVVQENGALENYSDYDEVKELLRKYNKDD